jgi:uracil-DNA glycosylase
MKPPKNEINNYLDFLKKQPKGFVYKDTTNKQTTPQKEKPKSKEEQLKKLNDLYKNCKKCPLATQGRAQVVFGLGNPDSKLMFVGEGPGRDEDRQGAPFVGRAGKLLTKRINAMNLKRDDIYISNVVKCRPPNNRAPHPQESGTCKNLILFHEIEIIKPKIICTLGASATQALLGDTIRISKARGNFFEFQNCQILPTFHPAYLLRNPEAKKEVWQDMKKVMEKLETC